MKKSIHLEELVDDDDLDAKVKFIYQPGELDEQLKEAGYIQQIADSMDDFMKNHINNAPIYGVFLTGGASRMGFIKDLVERHFKVPGESIFRDQDPSLSISQGVAELARKDLRMDGADQNLDGMIDELLGDDRIFETFAQAFSGDLYEELTDKMAEVIVDFGSSTQDLCLNDLNSNIERQVSSSIREFSPKVPEYISLAIDAHTAELKQKVEDMVTVYNRQGMTMKVPTLDVKTDISLDYNMSAVIDQVSNAIAAQSTNWTGVIAGGVLGGVIGFVFPIIGIIGGAALLVKSIFFSESDEEKRQKALAKNLNAEQRSKVVEEIKPQWESITSDIQQAIYSEVIGNATIKREISKAVKMLLNGYKAELKNAKILVD